MAFALLGLGFCIAQAQEQRQVVRVDETVTIESETKNINLHTGIVTYSGDVVVTYGVTNIRADQVTIYLESSQLSQSVATALSVGNLALAGDHLPVEQIASDPALLTRRGEASGNVVLTDPDGTIRADALVFDWILNMGYATTVDLEVAGVSIQASRANFSAGQYELIDVRGTSCPDLYSLASRRVVVYPGNRAVIERPRLRVLGLNLPPLPNYSVALQERSSGIRLPSLSFHGRDGIGVRWSSGFLLDERTAIGGGLGFAPNERPSYRLEIARSELPEGAGVFTPRSEFAERFDFGYYENISVGSPEAELEFLSLPRKTYSLGTIWNQSVQTPEGEVRLSKSLEGALEFGGGAGSLGHVSQLRLHRIREENQPFQTRLLASTSIGLKPLEFGPNLFLQPRLDLQGFLNENSLFGWGRLQLGAYYQPSARMRIGGAFVFGEEAGTPAFSIDRLHTKRAFHARGDFDMGNTKLSILSKYDFDDARWYDHQVAFSQVIGCVEPFILWRQLEKDFRFGVNLRLDRFLDLLNRRDFRKRAEPTNTGMSHGR